jgi:nucleotide-binding universal stress UspA family protein
MDPTGWNPRTVVVGIDGSTQSRHAASMAAALCRAQSAKLHLVTVVRPPEGWWGIVGSPPTPTALSKTLTDAQREILDTAIQDTDLEGVKYETVEEVGDPARMLIEYCESVNADLLVVGKRGAGLLERIVLGSVANRVANDAPCPVLLVP